MATGHAWVLNLDADVELAALASGVTAYAPTARVLASADIHAKIVAGALLGPDDVLVDAATPPGAHRGRIGRAFCPTPRALALLRRAGCEPEPAPPADVLVRVNGRAFATSLGETLAGGSFETTREGVLAKIAAPPPRELSESWRLKRAYGMAGRGQRIVTPGAPAAADLALIEGGLREGGLRVEPELDVVHELAIHGFVRAEAPPVLGEVVAQRCDARGRWLATEPLALGPEDSVAREHVEAVAAEGASVAGALRDAGYVGPFGVDAIVYRRHDGALALQRRSEINARWSMGFAVGMGLRARVVAPET